MSTYERNRNSQHRVIDLVLCVFGEHEINYDCDMYKRKKQQQMIENQFGPQENFERSNLTKERLFLLFFFSGLKNCMAQSYFHGLKFELLHRKLQITYVVEDLFFNQFSEKRFNVLRYPKFDFTFCDNYSQTDQRAVKYCIVQQWSNCSFVHFLEIECFQF